MLTPHPGEMARLLHTTVGEITADIPGAARKAARKFQAVCVMKDARTVTAAPDGQTWINNAGSSALATGGSGDVLTGIIAALLAKGAPAFDGAAGGGAPPCPDRRGIRYRKRRARDAGRRSSGVHRKRRSVL